MGQYAVLAVLAAIVLGGAVLFNAQRSAQGADDELTGYHGDRFSREAALVGLKRMERRLAANLDEWNDTESTNAATRNAAFALFNLPTTVYGGGSYQTTFTDYQAGTGSGVTATSDLAFVTAVGRYDGERFTVRAVYEKGRADVGTPPSMRAAIVANGAFALQGNPEIGGSTHSNGSTTTTGNSFNVYGSGSYTNGSAPSRASRFTGGAAQRDSIRIPMFTFPPASFDFRTSTTPANYTLNTGNAPSGTVQAGWNGVTNKGTATAPYVLYVNGNLNINGAVRLRGHVRIYVNGSVTMGSGNSSLSPSTATLPNNNASQTAMRTWVSTNLPSGSTLAIYASGGVTLSGNQFIAAHIYTQGTFLTSSGNPMVIGGVTSRGNITLQGSGQIYYTDANASLYDPGVNLRVPEGVRLLAYREHPTR